MGYILLLLVGFMLLISGAHFLVNMCVIFAQRLHIPAMIIGMTVIAFGTSLPEFIVGLHASISDENIMVFGNVVGSNILNVLVMLGLCAVIYPCTVSRQSMRIDIPIAVLAAVLMLLLPVFSLSTQNEKTLLPDILYFSRFDGLLLVSAFVCFMIYTAKAFVHGAESTMHCDLKNTQGLSMLQNIIGLIISIIALISGGHLVISSAVGLASFLGVSTRIISIVVVAFGTSLPELAVSIASALKKQSDFALGNIIGSNIFNVFFILGTCVLISPIKVEKDAILDLIVHVLSISLLAFFTCFSKTHTLSRISGLFFLFLYALYMVQLL